MLQALSTLQDVQEMYRWFENMRATRPVWLDESSGCWHVFRYEDVLRVSTDYQLFSSRRPEALRRVTGRSTLATSRFLWTRRCIASIATWSHHCLLRELWPLLRSVFVQLYRNFLTGCVHAGAWISSPT